LCGCDFCVAPNGVGEVAIDQSRIGEFGIYKAASCEVAAPQLGVAEIAADESAVREINIAENRSLQANPYEHRMRKATVSELKVVRSLIDETGIDFGGSQWVKRGGRLSFGPNIHHDASSNGEEMPDDVTQYLAIRRKTCSAIP
jgi:hypothetical protein